MIVNAGFQEIGIRRREAGLTDTDAIVATLRDILAENAITTTRAIGLVSGPSTALIRLLLPSMPDRELRDSLRWEAGKETLFSLEAATLNHVIQGDQTDKDGLLRRAVLVAAAETSHLLHTAGLLKAAGLNPVGFTLAPVGLWAVALQGQLVESPDEVSVLVDLGAEITSLVFVRGGEIQFAREIGTAGAALTEALTSAMLTDRGRVQLTPEQAEAIKRRHGIAEGDGGGMLDEGVSLAQIAVLIRPVLERLVVEIQRSFAYYQERYGGPTVGRVILTGGSARLRNLAPFFAQRLGLSVEVLNPFAGVDLSPGLSREGLPDVAPRFATALGAVLDRARVLNLIPRVLEADRWAWRGRLALRSVLAVLALSTVGGYAGAHVKSSRLERTIRNREAEMARLQPALAGLADARARLRALAPQLEAYEALQKTRTPWPGILKELSRLTPPPITLEELVTADPTLQMRGIAFQDQRPAEEVIARYLGEMATSPYFRAVDLVNTRQRDGFSARAMDFEMALRLP